jgi:hypothetical protein
LQAWAEAFFDAAHLENADRQVGCVQHGGYSILNRANTTIFCTYTYDPEIDFSDAGMMFD